MTDNGDNGKGRPPEGGEGAARRARQAAALRRNLVRRKAQSRDRGGDAGARHTEERDTQKR